MLNPSVTGKKNKKIKCNEIECSANIVTAIIERPSRCNPDEDAHQLPSLTSFVAPLDATATKLHHCWPFDNSLCTTFTSLRVGRITGGSLH